MSEQINRRLEQVGHLTACVALMQMPLDRAVLRGWPGRCHVLKYFVAVH
jgi:hypothetical protein